MTDWNADVIVLAAKGGAGGRSPTKKETLVKSPSRRRSSAGGRFEQVENELEAMFAGLDGKLVVGMVIIKGRVTHPDDVRRTTYNVQLVTKFYVPIP